jgi:hypothetical protein
MENVLERGREVGVEADVEVRVEVEAEGEVVVILGVPTLVEPYSSIRYFPYLHGHSCWCKVSAMLVDMS